MFYFFFKNNYNFCNTNQNSYIKASFCSMSYPGIGRMNKDIYNDTGINNNLFFTDRGQRLHTNSLLEDINTTHIPFIEKLNNGINYKKFKLLGLYKEYLPSVDLDLYDELHQLYKNTYDPPLPLMLESPIKPFSFSYSTYKNIINHKYQIGLDSKIGFGGIDLLINNKYTPSNLVKFKMGLFDKKVFYKNKFPLISNNVKFFLTPEMNIGNKNICLKTRYFTAFRF